MDEEEDVRAALKDMSFKELTALQHKIRLEKQHKYENKGVKFSGYIPDMYKAAIPVVLDYLYDNKVIKKRTIYNLASVAVSLVIDDILDKIKKGRETSSTP